MAAAGVGIHGRGENPGTEKEITDAVRFCLNLGGDPNAIDVNGETALDGAALNVRSKPRQTGQERGFTPWRIAAGVFMNGAARQQLQTAELMRRLLVERGLTVE